MRTAVFILALLVILGAVSIDLSSAGSGVRNKPEDIFITDDILSGEVLEDLDFDRKKKPGRKSRKKPKKKKGKGKKGKKGKQSGPFREFRKTALANFENEIENLSCSNVEAFQSSHEGCGITAWFGCQYACYKAWVACRHSCNKSNKKKLCSLSCVKKEIDQRAICKKCIRQLLKAICCHYIGGECCIKADSEHTGDICCHLDEWPVCSNGKPECSVDHPCPLGQHCCPQWPPKIPYLGCCYRDTEECPVEKIETVITIMENGQEIKQNTTIDSSSGIITIEVPPHVTVLNQNFTQATTMYNPASNISVSKSNSSCTLSDIPDGMNEYFQQLEKGAVAWGNKTKKTVYDIQKEEHVLGPKTRAALIPEMNDLCNNELITKTETLKINQSQYEKLVNGEIVFIEKEQPTVRNSLRSCSLESGAPTDVCSGVDPISHCERWTNPQNDVEIDVHSISSRNLCTQCCNDKDPHCNCTEFYGSTFCPCVSITNIITFYDCVFKNGTFRTIIENYNASRPRSEDSGSSVMYQTLTYNSDVDERSIEIHVPAHGDNEETTVLMHADRYGQWHNTYFYYYYDDYDYEHFYDYYDGDIDNVLKNNMMLKLGSLCHVRSLPGRVNPIDIANNLKSISKGLDLENSILTSSNEKKKHFILLNDGPLGVQAEASLNEEIKEICKDAKLIRYQEIEINEEEFQKLNDEGIIDLKLESQTEECNVQTKVTSVAYGGWWFPKSKYDSGTESMVHGLYKSVIQANCCSKDSGHHSTYCNCEDIIDRSSFERCRSMIDMIVVIAGAHGFEMYDKFESFVNDSKPGLQLEALPAKPSLPVKTKGGIGAWISNSLYVCQGQIQGNVPDGDGCFMMKFGAGPWIKPPTTILTEPLKFGGAAAKYKSGPTGKELGETWWIVGADHLGTRTQEWNSVEGANPWDPPVLPQAINTPCMVAISDRKIFITAVPLYEAWTSKAWTYSRDYKNEEGKGWRNIPSLKEKRILPACGFLPNDRSGWIVVAGGRDKSSTEILDVTKCEDNDWDCDWEDGPELGSNFYGASMVTMGADYLVLVGDQTDMLAINSTFQNWEVVGEMSQPRYDSVVLTIPT